MIRLHDEPETVAVERLMAECPTCCGNGELFVERLFGRTAPEPYVTKACGSCGGTGQVDAEAVEYCAVCKGVFWVHEICTHQGEPLCTDCRPYGVCRDCVDDLVERTGGVL